MEQRLSKIDMIVNANSNIVLDENTKVYLKQLEKLIPENLRENFYHNLQTVKIIYDDNSIQNRKNGATGKYNSKTNTITILKNYIINNAISHGLDNKEVAKTFYQCLIHEFVHMAANGYNKNTNEEYIGFNKEKMYKNEGIDEGMAEFISSVVVNPKYNINTGYDIERYLTSQICTIIGYENLAQLYFKNLNQEQMENYLNSLGPFHAKELFKLIETHYTLKFADIEQPELEQIQNILLHCLKEKLINCQQEEINITLQTYSNWLITPEKIHKMGYNEKNYPNLDENKKLFESISNNFKIEECKHIR